MDNDVGVSKGENSENVEGENGEGVENGKGASSELHSDNAVNGEGVPICENSVNDECKKATAGLVQCLERMAAEMTVLECCAAPPQQPAWKSRPRCSTSPTRKRVPT